MNLPNIDFEAAARGDAQATAALGESLARCGFAVLRSHGVERATLRGLLDAGRCFFALPQSEKDRLEIAAAPQIRGYVKLGGESTGGVVDWHECVDVQPLLPDEHPMARPRNGGSVPGRHILDDRWQWPKAIESEFRQALIDAWDALYHLSERIVRGCAISLDLEADAFERYTGAELCDLRLAHYPRLPDDARASEGQMGMHAHCDNGLVTVFVRDEVPGLEIRVGESWVPAEQLPQGLLVAAGLMMERSSNGRLRAGLHRVRPPALGQPARYSAAFFFEPRYDAVIAPIGVSQSLEARYPPCPFGPYLEAKFSNAYEVGAPAEDVAGRADRHASG